jgi:pimeloyl-ACP methyl ester carboxylesterase
MITIAACLLSALVPASSSSSPPSQPTTETIAIRGHVQSLRVYGSPTGYPVIVSSGDGGWMHLAPQVADVLSRNGYFVVGFDSRAYLSSFTTATTSLQAEAEPGDYLTLVQFAAQRSGRRPILVGVSEGAGLSVLAATDPRTAEAIGGVVGLGLPDLNELGWRSRDMLIYLTHGLPNEPSFSTAAIVAKLAPVPLALIHSTRDEFVPVPQVERVLQAANPPKRLWLVDASNHRFEDKQEEFAARLLEAMGWVLEHAPPSQAR